MLNDPLLVALLLIGMHQITYGESLNILVRYNKRFSLAPFPSPLMAVGHELIWWPLSRRRRPTHDRPS